MNSMTSFDEMTELIAGERFGELSPNVAMQFVSDALSDTPYLEKIAGTKNLDTSAMFAQVMDTYSAQRYPAMARAAAESFDNADRRQETIKLTKMTQHLNMKGSDVGSVLAAKQLGDNSPMNQLRERFYFG